MAFSFEEYLSKIDSDQSYVIKRLTGGVVNLTVRAVKTSASSGGVFPDNQSLILKYAPPYVAGLGPVAPLSQFRQTIESRALSLLTTAFPPAQSVALPVLLKHDLDSNILAISDLGPLPNLSEAFSNIGGYTPMTEIPPVTNLPSTTLPSAQELRYYAAIGTKLGNFFAQLHSPRVVHALLNSPDRGPDYLSNPPMRAGVLEYAIRPTRSHLALFPHLADPAEADELYKRIEDNFVRPNTDAERSFVLGDCWTGAILVDPDSSNADPTVGVIDWEFANVHRGPHGDLSQLLAHFELFRIAAEHQHQGYYVTAVDAIVGSLATAYRAQSVAESAIWTTCDGGSSSSNSSDNTAQDAPPAADSVRATILRSALISHAAEMINCAFWKLWRCDSPTCPRAEDGSHTKSPQDCDLIKTMIERSVWYLRHSGADAEQFCSAGNWATLKTTNSTFKYGRGLLELL